MFWNLYEYTLQSGNGGGRERKLAVFGIGTLCFESLHFMFFFFFSFFFYISDAMEFQVQTCWLSH